MAAEAVAAEAVVSFVVEKLGDLIIQEAVLLHGVHDQVQFIQRELMRMQCFLKDAEARRREDEGVRHWVREIRDVSYDAEDVIDTYIARIKRDEGLHFVGCVERWCTCSIFSELRARRKASKEIHRIKKKIHEISKSRLTYGIRDIGEQAWQGTSPLRCSLHDRRRILALLEEPDVVGLKDDVKKLVAQLTNGESRRCVVSIVGMGGSGKTTLAKKVYNHTNIQGLFNCAAFVHLSQRFRLKEIMMSIIKCTNALPQEMIEASNEGELGKMLSKRLSEKRYLVVIDDIWSIEAWDALKLVLPDGLNKSRVMLTTRNREVALYADSLTQFHESHLLNDEEGWELFTKRVFPGDDRSAVSLSELEGIGKQIVAKCAGLPLAIVVLGGLLLRRDKTPVSWSKVLDSVTWHLSQSSNPCMEILALSYSDLPCYLKPCFLYFGLFPEDHEIPSKKLIKLWIAEGFIQQRGNEIMEDVGEEYLEELISRSMIQVARKGSDRTVKTCRIHDLLRDLSISEALQCNFFKTDSATDNSPFSTCVRRLAIHHTTEGYDHKNHSTTALRSILWFSGSKFSLSRLPSVRLLRVLDLENVYIPGGTLPKEIGDAVHLRYLNLRNTVLRALPSHISNLRNLQTLDLRCSGFFLLPDAFSNSDQLRHLYAYWCEINLRPRLGNLRNLQTLCIRAGSWIENGLEKLTNLRKLGLHGDLSLHHRALSESIKRLCSLRSFLVVNGVSIPPSMSFLGHLYLYKMSLNGRMVRPPEFPPNLTKLVLWHSQLQQDAMKTIEKLASLRVLKLLEKSFCGRKMIASSEAFPQLEVLQLANLEELEEFTVEEGAMPNLASLKIDRCPRLEILSERVQHLCVRIG